MIESVEIGFPHGMNGYVLNGNVCSVTPVNMSVPNNVSQILLELALLTLSSQEHSTVHFVKDLDEYLKLKSGNEHLKLTLVSKSLTEELAKNWSLATKEHNSYEEFKRKFLDQFWSKESQSNARSQIP
jgi:hypothetical protein